jgi:hypothetical protein
MDKINYYLDLIVNDKDLHRINKEELKVILIDFAKEYHKTQLSIDGVVKSLPSKEAVAYHLKEYASKEMTEYKPDELICFTSGALTLLRWLNENKIK